MNNNNGAGFTTRAVISALLVVALIVGIIFTGNYFDNKNVSTDAIYTNNSGNQKVTLDEDADEYNFKINFGNVKFTSTDETPYITVDSVAELKVYSDYSSGTYDVKFKYPNDGFFSFVDNWFDNNRNRNAPEITIYLPKEQLEKVTVDVSAGKVEMRNVNTDYLLLDVSAGKVDVADCVVTKLETELSAGKLDYYASNDVKSVESQVSAGKMDLYLPRNISGFVIDYDISAGSIDNDSNFDFGGMSSGFKRNGTATFGDESCKIELDVSAGSININDYD